jgi:hypothetical protein
MQAMLNTAIPSFVKYIYCTIKRTNKEQLQDITIQNSRMSLLQLIFVTLLVTVAGS